MFTFSKKARLFNKKIADAQNSIWEFEFRIHKTRLAREKARQDRDRSIEALSRIEAAIKGEKNHDKKKDLNKQKEEVSAFIKMCEEQMKNADFEVSGIPAKGDEPAQKGMIDVIKGLAELREMYRDFVSKI